MKMKTTEAAKRDIRALSERVPGRGPTRRQPERGLQKLVSTFKAASVMPLFPSGGERSTFASGRIVLAVSAEGEQADAELGSLHILDFDTHKEAVQAHGELAKDPAVEYIHFPQPRFCYKKIKKHKKHPATELDPLRSRQWGLLAVELFQAQQVPGFSSAEDIPIAVVDSGVDFNHPDLAGVVSDMQNFTPGSQTDTAGHGTHVTGIIGAVMNNQIGITGVCQSKKIMSLKALEPYQATGYYRAIEYATGQGARVMNFSLGGQHDPTEELLIRRAVEKGIAVVAAMGNEYKKGNPTSYPAAIEGVISVGASTEVDGHAPFSCTGQHIDLVAPGTNILSTVPTYDCEMAESKDYFALPGTSMATPFVTATVALMLAKRSSLTLAQITDALHKSCDKVPGQNGFSDMFGHGRLNIRRALAAV